MASRQVGNWLVIILIMLNCLALGGIFHVWWGQGKSPDLSQSQKTTDIPVTPMLKNQEGLDAFRIVSSKNLFSQDRTGPDLGAVASQKQADLEGKLLMGTIIIGNQRIALIGVAPSRKPRDAAVESVRQGEEWEGFKVMEITRDAVVFQGRNGTMTLQFPE
jgi:hypothetical protein